MIEKKTLEARQSELQLSLATVEGRSELGKLQALYEASSGSFRPAKTSIITYILVHERERGLISG